MRWPDAKISWLRTRIVVLTAMTLSGCAAHEQNWTDKADLAHYQCVATKIEYPQVADCPTFNDFTPSPLTLNSSGAQQFWELRLEDVLQISLQNSKVIQELGGLILRSPNSIRTIQSPSIVETDPRFGVEAALSAFDANFATRMYFQDNDRAVNNIFLGGGTRLLRQDLDTYQTQIQKRAATGTLLTVRNNTEMDANNSPGNQFYSGWTTNYEVEARQPLLQGYGVDFNRIAGPQGQPGFLNGVLLARVNTDVSLADFELGVRDLVSNVENTYWDLYFAYRDLDAKIAARDGALEIWRRIQALYASGRRGGEAEKEAQAREQYFRFQEEVQNAWSGKLVDGTRTFNGSSGGTARSTGGVRVVERRLRLLMGLPISEEKLIRPVDEPQLAKVVFDWDQILCESLTRRAELRRQKWIIKRRELELVASRNFLLPNLDAIGRYRWRGFGDDLLATERTPGQFNTAYQDLTTGDFQEWELGAEFAFTFGNRRGHAAVRNAQLQVARERAVLDQQEREITHDLSNAVSDLDRAYDVVQTNFNRRVAGHQQLAAVQAAYDVDKAPLDLLLEAQRRAAEADSRFFASLVEYALGLKNVHFEKGSLLDYNEIFLSEGPWPGKAYDDVARRAERTKAAGPLCYVFSHQHGVISHGPPPPANLAPPAPPLPAAPPAEVLPGEPQRVLPESSEPLPPPTDGAPSANSPVQQSSALLPVGAAGMVRPVHNVVREPSMVPAPPMHAVAPMHGAPPSHGGPGLHAAPRMPGLAPPPAQLPQLQPELSLGRMQNIETTARWQATAGVMEPLPPVTATAAALPASAPMQAPTLAPRGQTSASNPIDARLSIRPAPAVGTTTAAVPGNVPSTGESRSVGKFISAEPIPVERGSVSADAVLSTGGAPQSNAGQSSVSFSTSDEAETPPRQPAAASSNLRSPRIAPAPVISAAPAATFAARPQSPTGAAASPAASAAPAPVYLRPAQ